MQNIHLIKNNKEINFIYNLDKLTAKFVSKNITNNIEELSIDFLINPTGKIISITDFGGTTGNLMKTAPIDDDTIPKIKLIMDSYISKLGGDSNLIDWVIPSNTTKHKIK